MKPTLFWTVATLVVGLLYTFPLSSWRHKCAGYAWPLSWAGRFTEADEKEEPLYLHRGDDSIMVLASVIESLAVPPKPKTVDGDAGPVVVNNRENWKAILSAMIREPQFTPAPQYPGARKPKKSTG